MITDRRNLASSCSERRSGGRPLCFFFPFLPPSAYALDMGEWKAPVSLRVSQDLRRELEGVAARERRKLGNVGEVLLEWAVLQLRVAGTIERLLKVQLTSKPGKN